MAALPFLPTRLLWQLGHVDEQRLSDAPRVVQSIPNLKESDGQVNEQKEINAGKPEQVREDLIKEIEVQEVKVRDLSFQSPKSIAEP